MERHYEPVDHLSWIISDSELFDIYNELSSGDAYAKRYFELLKTPHVEFISYELVSSSKIRVSYKVDLSEYK